MTLQRQHEIISEEYKNPGSVLYHDPDYEPPISDSYLWFKLDADHKFNFERYQYILLTEVVSLLKKQ